MLLVYEVYDILVLIHLSNDVGVQPVTFLDEDNVHWMYVEDDMYEVQQLDLPPYM